MKQEELMFKRKVGVIAKKGRHILCYKCDKPITQKDIKINIVEYPLNRIAKTLGIYHKRCLKNTLMIMESYMKKVKKIKTRGRK